LFFRLCFRDHISFDCSYLSTTHTTASSTQSQWWFRSRIPNCVCHPAFNRFSSAYRLKFFEVNRDKFICLLPSISKSYCNDAVSLCIDRRVIVSTTIGHIHEKCSTGFVMHDTFIISFVLDSPRISSVNKSRMIRVCISCVRRCHGNMRLLCLPMQSNERDRRADECLHWMCVVVEHLIFVLSVDYVMLSNEDHRSIIVKIRRETRRIVLMDCLSSDVLTHVWRKFYYRRSMMSLSCCLSSLVSVACSTLVRWASIEFPSLIRLPSAWGLSLLTRAHQISTILRVRCCCCCCCYRSSWCGHLFVDCWQR
jgi:hypothetical protein